MWDVFRATCNTIRLRQPCIDLAQICKEKKIAAEIWHGERNRRLESFFFSFRRTILSAPVHLSVVPFVYNADAHFLLVELVDYSIFTDVDAKLP